MSQIDIFDVSGALQTATTWLQRQANEIYDAENMRFDKELGSAERRLGYSLYKQFIVKPPLAFFEAKFSTGVKIFYAYNNSGDTATVLSCYDVASNTSTDVKSDYPASTKLQMVMNAGELYVAGISAAGARQTIVNITSALVVSSVRNLFGSPKAQFVGENSGALYAMNVELGGVVYPDRAYISSPQRGAITYVNAAMSNTYAPVDLVNEIPPMTSNTTPSGVASASTENGGVWLAYGAFDRTTVRNPGQAWFSNVGPPGWLQYNWGSGVTKIITHYAVTAIISNPSNPNDTTGAPRDWTFEGSNDGSSWTVLQTVTSQTAWATSETRTFANGNTTAYQYYRINISANNGFASYTNIAELAMFSTVQSTREQQVKVDSARYVKAGLTIDIYKAGTNTKLYTITPTSVDNSKDTFNFLPYNTAVTSAVAATDLITIASTTSLPTGTTILFQTTGTLPAPLVANTTYYVINISSTTFKVASTLSDAKIGASIDLTTAGTGVLTTYMSYQMSKTDELWLAGRQGDGTPSLLWNTDYRTPQNADFIYIASGKVADTSVIGWAKSNNRMNIFTKTSMWQYDNANFIPIFEDIGCISHDTICNHGTFIIWLDATGKVRARDSASGQDQIISRAIKNQYLDNLSSTNLSQSSAIMYDSNYKLAVGSMAIGGVSKITRFIYNFDMNVWWREAHTRRHVLSINSSISGTRRNYFLDEIGGMYLDEDTNTDAGVSIPWFLQWGRRDLGLFYRGSSTKSSMKSLTGIYVHAKNIAGSPFMVKTTDKWQTLGSLTEATSRIEVSDNTPIESRDFDFKVSGNSKSDPAKIEGIEVWHRVLQSNF